MKITKFDKENEEQWLDYRSGKITGSKLKDIIVKRGTSPKIGFYSLIAQRIAIPPTEEKAIYRGKRLEEEALERFEKETGKTLIKDLVIWTREDNEDIAFSPDGYTKDLKEVADAKCFNSENHIKAYINQKVPSEIEDQVIQAFCVNDKLETFYLVFYDPRMPKDFFYLTIKREEVQDKVIEYLEYQKNILEEVEMWANKLTF
jgi:predicted phage-related endonuclease